MKYEQRMINHGAMQHGPGGPWTKILVGSATMHSAPPITGLYVR